jgi:hypothetical protein
MLERKRLELLVQIVTGSEVVFSYSSINYKRNANRANN